VSQLSLIGTEMVRAQLLALPDTVRKRLEREAVGAANKLLAAVITANAPQDSGALKKSIGTVIRSYRSGQVVVGVIGPKSDYAGYVIRKGKRKTFKKAKKGENKGIRKPSKYAHLVNGGTTNRVTQNGANRGSVTPKWFMEDSFDAVKDQIQQIFETTINKTINQ
jgi:HK97 gp10 family phage protein